MACVQASPVVDASAAQPLASPTKKPRGSAATPGDFCSLTKLLGGNFPISQDVFTRAISRPGVAPKDVCALFEFYRPVKRPSAMTSSILRLTDKQHDVLYALSGCSDVACTMSKVDKKTRKALLHVYGIDKTQFSTWFKNRRPKPRKDGSRREVTALPNAQGAPAGEGAMGGSCEAAADLLVDTQQQQVQRSAEGGSWAGSLTGAPMPIKPEHEAAGACSHAFGGAGGGLTPRMSPTGADRKRRPSACSRHESPTKAARSPPSTGTDNLPRLPHLDDMPHGGHDAAAGAQHASQLATAASHPGAQAGHNFLHSTYSDPVPNHFLPQSRQQAAHYQQHVPPHQQEHQQLQPVYEGSYAPAPGLTRVNTAPGPQAFRQPSSFASRSCDNAQAAAAQGLPNWFDLPEWPDSPSDSDEKRDLSMLILSQSAIAAVAADAAAAAEEASGLMPSMPSQMRQRSQSYPGSGAFGLPQPGFLQQQRGCPAPGYPAQAAAGAGKIAAYQMRAPGNRATLPGYGSELPHPSHYGPPSKASLGGFCTPSPWAHAHARQPGAPHQGLAPSDGDRQRASEAGHGAMVPSWMQGPDRRGLAQYQSGSVRWREPEWPQWGGAVTSGATLRSPKRPAAASRSYSMQYHDGSEVRQDRDAVEAMMRPVKCMGGGQEHGMQLDGQGDEVAPCQSPSWGMVQQQRVRKGTLGGSPAALPLSIGDAWPAESAAELEGFDLNAFGFLDELSME